MKTEAEVGGVRPPAQGSPEPPADGGAREDPPPSASGGSTVLHLDFGL